ncbi:MAG: PCRF domain-containing protein, partial [Sphingomonadaceae bacterium]|nr:PCRF domain-containing protein [Sphingomonadaceae bacterium]
MTSIPQDRIDAILARHDELQRQMSGGDLAPEKFVQLSKEYAEVGRVAEAARELARLREEFAALGDMLADPELKEMAQAEAEALRDAIPAAERDLALRLLPRDS